MQWIARGMGSPRQVHNRRRRTREGPKPACVHTPLHRGWHTQGEKDEGGEEGCGSLAKARATARVDVPTTPRSRMLRYDSEFKHQGKPSRDSENEQIRILLERQRANSRL